MSPVLVAVLVVAVADLTVVDDAVADLTVVVGCAAMLVCTATLVVGVVVVFESDPQAARSVAAIAPTPSLVMLCMGLLLVVVPTGNQVVATRKHHAVYEAGFVSVKER